MTFRGLTDGVEVAPLVWRLLLTWQISWQKIASAYIPSCMMRRPLHPKKKRNIPKALKGCGSGGVFGLFGVPPCGEDSNWRRSCFEVQTDTSPGFWADWTGPKTYFLTLVEPR